MKRLLALTAMLVTALGGSVTAGAGLAPDALVRDTTDKVLQRFTAERAALEQDHMRLYALVDELVLPHFDFERMSRLVLGRYWSDANEAQQARFVDEFRTLLVRTYATALFEYTGQPIRYKAVQINDKGDRALVRTEIVVGAGPAVPMHYRLALNDDHWKVYDITVDNVSLVTNYRASYSRVVQSQGMQALIDSLAEKNQQPQ